MDISTAVHMTVSNNCCTNIYIYLCKMRNKKHETELDSMVEFRAAYAHAIRDRHPQTKVELFMSYWRHNYPFMTDMIPADDEIESFIANNVSIAAACYAAAEWMLDNAAIRIFSKPL